MPRSYRKSGRRRSRRFSRRTSKRSLRRRFRGRRRSRKSGGIRNGAITAPRQLLRKFKFRGSDIRGLDLTVGTTRTYNTFNCNSLFQFETGSPTPQNVPGLTEMASLYSYCKVHSVKIKVSYCPFPFAVNSETAPGVYWQNDPVHLVWNTRNEGTPSGGTWEAIEAIATNNPDKIMEAWITPELTTGRWKSMKKYFKLSNFAIIPREYKSEATYGHQIPSSGILASNPSQIIEADIVLLSGTSAGAINRTRIRFVVDVTYYVYFTQKKVQTN